MVRLLRRIVLASILVGGAVFVVRRRGLATGSPHDPSPHTSSTAWPPITDDDGVATSSAPRVGADRRTDVRPFVEVANEGDAAPVRWVAPVDGRCPDGYSIKANDNSMIFHVPGGRFYDRTVPERCYADADAAAADGYRAAKA
jgi:hypothetical protein